MSNGAILVTGAGGFVCSEIVLALHRAGRKVIAVDQAFDAATRARLAGVEMVEGALSDGTLAAVTAPLFAVIHGAAITASPERLGVSNAAHVRRNMDVLTATLDFARNAGAERFLFISSMGVFNPDDTPVTDGLITEATRPTATCTYCAAKHAGELLVQAARDDNFTTLSLRLGNITGPYEAVRETRQHLCLVARMVAEAKADGVITVQTPDALREWSWLPDLAGAIAGLITDTPWDGPTVIHTGTPPTISDLDLARAVADRILGTTIRLASPPHAQIRPPMGSKAAALRGVNWTTMEGVLDNLIPVEAPQ
ncbi:NAD(P)-dependent oxidoreductase [Gymnodinialimonas sp. 57CJ19]|uniref:NAD-dependent epimerase/dehydratase family protein n=1 Tax=Gymnodinialimonas sp. 57CJ19 TaxID=3138498 RepID=UPI0031343384